CYKQGFPTGMTVGVQYAGSHFIFSAKLRNLLFDRSLSLIVTSGYFSRLSRASVANVRLPHILPKNGKGKILTFVPP
ncbi:MAG: hypothetical protein KDC65_18070, partial [Saprospiraceae bacterium]|nr:hypothetical protein [Saprospiraceae bacterium]